MVLSRQYLFSTSTLDLNNKILNYTLYLFHEDIIRRAVLIYIGFNLSFREIEKYMIEHGVGGPYKTKGHNCPILRAILSVSSA